MSGGRHRTAVGGNWNRYTGRPTPKQVDAPGAGTGAAGTTFGGQRPADMLHQFPGHVDHGAIAIAWSPPQTKSCRKDLSIDDLTPVSGIVRYDRFTRVALVKTILC